VNAVAPSYLDTLEIKLRSGRNFTEADNAAASQVVMINESLAHTLFGNENPVGHRIGLPDASNRVWYEIVGVVPDTGFAAGIVAPSTSHLVLRPLAQETWNYVTVALRAPAAGSLTGPMRQAVTDLDPDLALQQFNTVDEMVKIATGSFSMIKTILTSFALLGLFLAALGLYGVIARIVVQRTPEIGVRVALGAQGGDVVWLILRSGLKLTLFGAAFGLLGAFGLGQILVRILPGMPVTDPVIFGGMTLLLVAIGLLACWLPARRATKVDPMVALRAE
jgi:hypothetical protein